jgi:hypothetical protein
MSIAGSAAAELNKRTSTVMHLHVWLALIAASAVMGLAPGPAVTSIVGYALSSGRATALAAVAGLALGNLIAMSLSQATSRSAPFIPRPSSSSSPLFRNSSIHTPTIELRP